MKLRRWSKNSHQINMRNQINAPNFMIDVYRYGYRRIGFKKWCQPAKSDYRELRIKKMDWKFACNSDPWSAGTFITFISKGNNYNV